MLTVKELKKMLEEFPEDMKVVTSSAFRQNFEDLKGPPRQRLVRSFTDEKIYGDWVQYEPLYSTQEEKADEEVVVIW